jgi:hypothetical protein
MKINSLEKILKCLVKDAGLEKTVIALHNVSCHGDIFEHGITDDGLGDLFDLYVKIIELAKKEKL